MCVIFYKVCNNKNKICFDFLFEYNIFLFICIVIFYFGGKQMKTLGFADYNNYLYSKYLRQIYIFGSFKKLCYDDILSYVLLGFWLFQNKDSFIYLESNHLSDFPAWRKSTYSVPCFKKSTEPSNSFKNSSISLLP